MRFLIRFFWLLGIAGNVAAQSTTLPLTGYWNGYLQHLNVVECSNLTDTSASLLLTVLDYHGSTLGTANVEIAARGTSHTTLNSFPIADSYGVYRVENLSQSVALDVSCQTAFYRMAAVGAPKSVEYAFVLPSLVPLNGESYGVFNSMNPSYATQPVANFLSIINPGTAPLSGRVEVFNQSGDLDYSFDFTNLASLERRDYPLGHPDGQIVGTYKIIPDDISQNYGAFLIRYAQNDQQGYDFAIPLLALYGGCYPGPVPASTMNPATNWGEVSNLMPWPQDVLIQIMDRFGTELFRETRTIPAHSQHHVYINPILGENNVGTFQASCTTPDRGDGILVQSFYYGRLNDQTNDIEWAYASQGRAASLDSSQNFAVQLNTNLGAANWLKILDAGNHSLSFNYDATDASGLTIAQPTTTMPQNGSVDIGLHETVGTNFIGLGIFYPQAAGGTYYPELLRVFPHASGNIGYIMNVPATMTTLTQATHVSNPARADVIDDYNNSYLTSDVGSEFSWDGSIDTCDPGTVPASVHAKVLQRINYFRRQAGLPDDVTFDSGKNAKCQQAALMMSANHQLSHTPPNTWACYTTDGYDAASHSNLTLGHITTTVGIRALMSDDGSNNTAVGHRRWFLYPPAKIMGHGSTGNSMAVWVIGDFGPTPPSAPEFVAWPPQGFVPAPIVPYARWSFSVTGADFDATTITMTDSSGNPVSLVQNPVAYGYGDATIVWEPSGIITGESADLDYHVTVSNVVVGSQTKNYSYTVTIVQP